MKTMQYSAPVASFANALEQRRYRDVLILWLRWNEAYELATVQMFSPGQRAATIEDFMDKMDQLRREAISASHELLDGGIRALGVVAYVAGNAPPVDAAWFRPQGPLSENGR